MQDDLAGMETQSFDAILSLGSRCQVAHQLRRIYPQIGANFFDWLITPDQALLKMLDEGLPGFSEGVSFKLGPSHKKPYRHRHVLESDYGCLLSHDFLNDGAPLESLWPAIKGKYEKTSARFRETLSGARRVLFVRMSFGPPGSFGYDREDRADFAFGQEVSRRIRARWPELDYRLLLISHHAEDARREGEIEVVHLPEQTAWNWQGLNEDWDRVFKPYALA